MRTVGGIIAAANKCVAYPMKKVGSISLIQRIVLTYKKAGIWPIVVITGFEEPEIKSDLAREDAIFIINKDYENPPLIDSYKIGLKYLLGKCNRVLLTPVNVPMFNYTTVLEMIETKDEIVIPSYNMHGGHPLLIDSLHIPSILSYDGENGLKGAIDSLGAPITWLNVNDKGVTCSVKDEDKLEELLTSHNDSLFQPALTINIRKEKVFLDSRLRLLLELIDDNDSVNGACKRMSLSLSKAWDMINELEKSLGYEIVLRRRGGAREGRTQLSPKGREFMDNYDQFYSAVNKYTWEQFKKYFVDKTSDDI
ncbi:NTP transferase domain-containing protein [Clostridium bowmanii]|uniref:NTP transferase domain-containing protein n=1 Tax=Clostridium bowmanii TaxID=132925 RepID=UPI001C0C387B|nr:NTP transferase domain-containing protein [Clostridium bowmanii]MBU3189597.1 NTP transferase domain-containing protein [Clostridium bowmanii]MCA1073559.1 NTP transferase domain-containing protein [Clostridium bowmanii]